MVSPQISTELNDARNAKRPRLESTNESKVPKTQPTISDWTIKQRRAKIAKTTVVLGRQTGDSIKLKSMKPIQKKKLTYVGKLDPCTREELVHHLTSIGVNVTSCTPLINSIFNKLHKKNTTLSIDNPSLQQHRPPPNN